MKILQVLSLVLCLSLGYVMPAMSASDEAPAKMEMMRKGRPEMRRHRAMSMAMMKDLELNDEQKAQWKALSEQKNEEMKPLREQMQKLRKQERKINKKYEEKIKKILTADQIAKYEAMLPQKPGVGDMPKGERPMPKKK